jgi:hypothetical protein
LPKRKDPAAVKLGRKGGKEIAKRGPEHFRQPQARRKKRDTGSFDCAPFTNGVPFTNTVQGEQGKQGRLHDTAEKHVKSRDTG